MQNKHFFLEETFYPPIEMCQNFLRDIFFQNFTFYMMWHKATEEICADNNTDAEFTSAVKLTDYYDNYDSNNRSNSYHHLQHRNTQRM